jgi:replicative DNA helicase
VGNGVLSLLTVPQVEVNEALAGPQPTTAAEGAREAADEAFSDKVDLGESSGIIAYDRIAGTMRPGELTIIGARTGDGKTSWGLTVAGNVALRGSGVLYCATADMNAKELMLRLACSWAAVSSKRAFNHVLTQREKSLIVGVMPRFNGLPLVLDPSHGKTVQAIEEQVKRVRLAFMAKAKKLRLLVVDYVQETSYQSPPKDWNEERILRNVSRVLKEIAVRHKIHVLGLVQMHPPPHVKKGERIPRPTIDNIQNCKAIARPASTVGFIVRQRDERGFYPPRGKVAIALDKARWGGASDVPVIFDGPFGRFENDPDEYDGRPVGGNDDE